MQYARIEWRENQPYSLDFKDVYFSTDDGLLETQYVFIKQNDLENRFKNLNKPTFSIIETGFGTGLNFLAIADCWLKNAPKSAKLQFISIEKYPLKLADLKRAHALWPQFSAISHELIEQYPTLKANCNSFSMAASRIQLAFWACDVKDALPAINQTADAWVLDGFAPAKNQDMWTHEIFEHIARLSIDSTTFATFTSAGNVRRGLQTVGFKCTKHVGYGKKREMLSGIFAETSFANEALTSEIIVNNQLESKPL